jgi:asparagine synthase (glutamine-hydrolysing)
VSERVRTFSVGFDDPAANELSYARLVAGRIGAEHREVIVSPADFFGALPQLVWQEDEPIATPASVPLHFVSRLAREHVKVVLTGEGADELFLGYNRYRVAAWNQRLGRAWEAMVPGAGRRAAARLARALPARAKRYAELSFLTRSADPRALFFDAFSVFPAAGQRALFADPALRETDPHAEALGHYESAPGGMLDRMSHADLQTYLVELLMKQDQMSMSASIESRVPFLDHTVVEYAAAMPGRFKLRGGQTKAVLREAVRDLVPAEILTRPKMGFPVPLASWLRGPFWPVVDDLVLGTRARARQLFVPSEVRRLADDHRTGAGRHADRLWLLMNLEIWQRIFLDGEDVTLEGKSR